MNKRILILVLAVALVLSLSVNTAAADYSIHLISPANAGSSEAAVTTISTQDSALPYALTTRSLTGHTFNGWYMMDGTTRVTQLTATNIKSIAENGEGYLFGYWDSNVMYPVIFETNGGSPVTPVMACQTKIEKPTDPVRSGSKFTGWYQDKALKTAWDFGVQTVTDPTILYAGWDVQIATLTFDVNFTGGNDIVYKQKPGSAITPPSTPTRLGFTFGGWYNDPTGGALVTVPTYMPDQNVTIYAHWNPNNGTPYIVNHYCQELNGSYSAKPSATDNLTGNTGAAVVAKAREFAGFSEDTLHKDRVATATIAPEGTTVLSLYYSRNTCTINFHENGGETVNDITGLYGSAILQPLNPDRKQYIFGGWYSNAALTTPYIFPATMPAANVDLYAKWLSEYAIVTYNYNYSGAPAATTEQLKTGSTANKPKNPSRDGYTFSGWFTDAESSHEYAFSTKLTEDITLYAGWSKNAVTYADVPANHWGKTYIAAMTDLGYFYGETVDGKSLFYPERAMTRAEFVTILGRCDNVDPSKYSTSDYTFTDIPANVAKWAGPYVAWAAKNDIVSGKDSAGKIFDPTSPVKRQEMAIIIGNYFKYKKVTLTGDFTTVTFSDKASVWKSAQQGVAFCADTKIIGGYTDGTFGPDRNMTRAEAATVLSRIVNYFAG